MKSLLAIVAGVLLIALALFYGMSGSMSSSISKRGESIARWETELVASRARLDKLMADADQLSKKPDPTDEERTQLGYMVSRVERDVAGLRFERERIDGERDAKKQMIMITAGLALAGAFAILFGVLRRRSSSRSKAAAGASSVRSV